MRTSCNVDAAYHALVARLQRGGTNVSKTKKPDSGDYRLGFRVFTPAKPDIAIPVEIVYNTRSRAVMITASELPDSAPRSFVPVAGNCPSLDVVESFIRVALERKQNLPIPQPVPETSSLEAAVEPVPPRKTKRGRREEPQLTGVSSE